MERNLILDAKHGCDDAFAKIVNRYSPILKRICIAAGVPIDDISDVVQEVFIKVYRFIGQVEVSTFQFWLYKITINTARDMGRKQLVWNNKFDLVQKDQIIHSSFYSSSVEERIMNKADCERLIDCIIALDAKYQIPLVLHFFHFLKYEDISSITGDKASTIKVRVLRAKKKIKQKF